MGFGNPVAERAAIEKTYEDTMAVLRDAPVTAGSITKMVPVEVYTGVSCALSYVSDKSRQTEAQNVVDYTAKVFCAPDLRIEPGDTLQVTRFGAVLSFEVVGRPPVYATHQEVKVRDGDLS